MNEWSPGGNYSRPGTPNQYGMSFRHQWDEPEKGTKPLVVNIKASPDKTKTIQEHSLENVSKSSVSVSSKLKKNEFGGSDPRFKRVIINGLQIDACVGTEAKSFKQTIPEKIIEKDGLKSKFVPWSNAAECKSHPVWDEPDHMKMKPLAEELINECFDNSSQIPMESVNGDQIQETSLKAVDKLTFSRDILIKPESKESISNYTINTMNTSLTSEDLLDTEISMLSAATRAKKVQNWIQDQKSKARKKQSVVTVIGQTQGQDNLSSALREIDRRRKLVKELDKYAVCEKITDTVREKEVPKKTSNASNSERICSERELCRRENESFAQQSRNGSGDTFKKHLEKDGKVMINSKTISNLSINENSRRSECTLTRKNLSAKKKTEKSGPKNEFFSKGKLQNAFGCFQYQWVFYLVFLASGILCWITFSSLHNGSYVSFDFFARKPKTMTWYEKICMWLWELFRPSGNYKRSIPWNSY